MEKVVTLLWGPADPVAGDALRDRLLSETVPRLQAAGARGIGINVHDSDAAGRTLVRPRAGRRGAPRGRGLVLARLLRATGRGGGGTRRTRAPVASYLVVESLYDDYGTTPRAGPRDWPDGARSPGVLTVALIHRPPGPRRR